MSNWTATIRTLTIGDGTDYPILQPGISGLGLPAVRAADQPRGHLSGDVGGDDVFEKRTLTIPVGINKDTAELAMAALAALKAAWAPASADIPLVLTVAGTSFTYQGRPRGFETDVSFLGAGFISVLLTFEALNPFAAGDPVDVAV